VRHADVGDGNPNSTACRAAPIGHGQARAARRVSIICQISSKQDTDLDLLYANIEPNLADRDFFIRKAIGWALRAYAWTDPAEVARYVRRHESQLSGLSRREALKNVPT
jgi:3-methyladenine DNA glycosylase AlkD